MNQNMNVWEILSAAQNELMLNASALDTYEAQVAQWGKPEHAELDLAHVVLNAIAANMRAVAEQMDAAMSLIESAEAATEAA